MKAVVLLILATTLAACSTVAGVGKDLQSSAEWTKEKISKPSVELNKGN
jgi:predicted small secreted protein